MKNNEGKTDRLMRVFLGLCILPLAFLGPQTQWAYLGLIPLVTGLVGICPLYYLVGMNTCPVKK